ncbi:MAG: hypothetical protein B7Z15_04555 [Rhizobiales bacterium 32-66-8]|nr:MAG: hypothetical protein B7Z15_04555 [Rhizobiales bacterium 32-66-8]
MPTQRMVAIVEDDPSARAALVSLVHALDYCAWDFADPLDFLASRASLTAVCLIADVRLPGISGVTLFHRLQLRGIALPTILITAFPDAESRLQALAAGVLAYLAKPVAPDELQRALGAAVSGRGPRGLGN